MIYALNKIRRMIAIATHGDTSGVRRAAALSVAANAVLEHEVNDSCFKTNSIPSIIRRLADVLVCVEKVAMFYGYSIPELIELAAEDL